MKIAITGSSGLIGTAVTDRLKAEGHEITRVVRSREAAAEPGALFWKPARGEIDATGLAGHDAVINLAGENIFGIWTDAKKRRIRESRVKGTSLLADTLAAMEEGRRPELLINASAIGYYGDRPPDRPLTEDADPGDGFMAQVVVDWEGATAPAREAGLRVVCLRFGLVLDPDALLLQGMGTSARLGLAAKIGSGRQVFPWVTRDEIANVVPFVLDNQALHGPVNVTAPEKATNEEFADTVAGVLDRPRVLKVPSFVMKMLGDFGEELLGGAWVVPEKLQEAGYLWRDPELEPALRRMLRKS